VNELVHPAPQAFAESCGVLEQSIEHLLERKKQKPDEDVRMERSTSLSLNFPACSEDRAQKAKAVPAGSAAVSAPLLRHLADLSATQADTFGADAQDVQEEKADHQLKDDCLAHRIPRKAFRHLAVPWEILVHAELHSLDNKQEWLPRVCQIGSDKRQGRAEAQVIRDALPLEEPPMAIGPNNTRSGLV
jgi:hypothetical protein